MYANNQILSLQAEWDKELRKTQKKISKKMNKREKEDNKEAVDHMYRRQLVLKKPSEFTDMDKIRYF